MSLNQEEWPSETPDVGAEVQEARVTVSTDLWHIKIELDGFETSPFFMDGAKMICPKSKEEIADSVKDIPVSIDIRQDSTEREAELKIKIAEDLREMLAIAMIQGAWWLHVEGSELAYEIDPFIGQVPKDSYGIKDKQNDAEIEILNFGYFPLDRDQQTMLQAAMQKMIIELGPDFTRYITRIVYRKDGAINNHLFISWTSKTLILPELMLRLDTSEEAYDKIIHTFQKALMKHYDDTGESPIELSSDVSIEELFKEPMPNEERFVFTVEESRVLGILVPTCISL